MTFICQGSFHINSRSPTHCDRLWNTQDFTWWNFVH